MKKAYRFNVPEERPKFKLPKGLIPLAISEAENVQPCEEVRREWENQIMADIAANRPSSWKKFLSRYIP